VIASASKPGISKVQASTALQAMVVMSKVHQLSLNNH
jgi:hypothetical protein